MRLRVVLCTVCCTVLAACQPPGGAARLNPEEVLKKAADATQTLESAQYVLEGNFDATAGTWTSEGSLRMDGSLNDAGEQLHFLLDVTADVRADDGDYAVQGNLEVSLLSRNEVYMNIHSLTSQPPNALFRSGAVRNIVGRWWLLPAADAPPEVMAVTPDPRLLHMQSQVITVKKDRGTETIDGNEAYHYDVVLDEEKLIAYLSALAAERGDEFDAAQVGEDIRAIAASGELWIDAKTFYIKKIVWNVQQAPVEGDGTASASVTIVFRNHNAAPDLKPPLDAKPFTPDVLFSLPEDALFPEEIPGGATELEDVDIEDILRSLDSP